MSETIQQPLPEPQAEEVEVEFDGEEADFDQAPPKPQAEAEEEIDTLDAIVPKAEPRTWNIGPEDMRRTFVQKPLSFIGKMQWFSLTGEVLDKALTGDSAMSLNGLFSAPGRPGQFRAEDFRDADTFVQAISKLLSAAPNFLLDSYLIWLNVPDYDQEIVKELMKLPPDEGGLSDDDGIGIIETFLDQNYDALASFFGDRLGQLQARVTKLSQLRESRRSKR
jgi:hypothetical protein